MVDASTQKSDLYIAGTCVRIVRFEVADDFSFIDCFAVWHISLLSHGKRDFPFGKPLARLVAELTAIFQDYPGISVEESGKTADL